jgi:hypothetical protein
MQMPFTAEEFLAMFERYNQAIWPLQIVAYALGLAVIGLAIGKVRQADRLISAILAGFWLWTGIVFQWIFFRQVDETALVFGALFVLQGILFFAVGVVQQKLIFRAGADPIRFVGSLLMLYALVIYPLIGAWVGHGYPHSPLFGVAPCPTTIFTFGLLLWTEAKVPKYLLIIPLIWGMLTIGAALTLGIREDFALPVASLLSTALLLWRDRSMAPPVGRLPRYAV